MAASAGGRTPVHWAVLGNHLPVLDFLIQKGAFPDSYDANDDSPLHLAARQGSPATSVPLSMPTAAPMPSQFV